jgi:hypothetical protein
VQITSRVRRVVTAALALLATPALAVDYWVKNGGDDGASGTSVAQAWATLPHAADRVGPGDTVHVLDGSYQGFYLTTSGTAAAPITFRAEGSAVQITADNPTTPDGINLEGASHVVIDGFVVNNRTRTGVRAVTASFVTVRNCTLGFNGHWGILTGFVDDFLAEGNEAHHSQLEHGIYVSNSCARPVVRGNVVHDNHANGLHFNGDASEGGTGRIDDALVEDNVIYGNGAGGGSGINMDGSVGGVIRNNLLYDNHASGVSLYRIDASTGSTGNLVENNTIVNAADARWCVNINTGSTGNVVRNNILYNLHPSHGAITVDASSRSGLVSDYNAVIDRFSVDGGSHVLDLAGWQALGYDAHSFVTTPAVNFVAPGSDFHLLPTSPAVDAGTSAGAPPTDLDGNARPVGAGIDIGAYEVQLSHCGDGTVDPGEQCGESGLSCGDPCTTCRACVCAQQPAVCGDGRVCGAETCEADADCATGTVCQGCQCVKPSVCSSGIPIGKPSLRLTASPFSVRLKGEAVIPKPWTAVDPATHGLRIVVDSASGAGGLDVTLPADARWSTNDAGTRWTYTDREGGVSGITKAVVQDRSSRQDGLLRFTVKGKGGSIGIGLPRAADVRTAVVLGAPLECGSLRWNPPGGARPRCDGDASRLRCH